MCIRDSFALSLIDTPESWAGTFNPFDVLRGALATEGHFTKAATNREVTIARYAVAREGVIQVRQRIIASMLSSFVAKPERRAFLAARLLSDALRGPISVGNDEYDAWDDEFAD